jgi:polysaccharide deacetylase family protein (PEP-CTERM system associated)
MKHAVLKNAMTIDVEDLFQVSAFAAIIPRAQWDTMPCRVERNIDLILSLLDAGNTRATFFTLGWIAERYPAMVRRIIENGHELASHGYAHQRVSELDRAEFREDVVHAKNLLEDLSGSRVNGYRAPSFSIGANNMWALDVLQETGHLYSSSIYPVQHDHYGTPAAPRFAYRPRGESGLLELPPTTSKFMGRNLPAGGGGYFRLLPYKTSRWLMHRVNSQDEQPCIFYFHPWELDPLQPRQHGISLKTRFRHYVNLSRTEARIQSLLRDFKWDRMDHIFLKDSA